MVSLCDDDKKVLALGEEHWEQPYENVFLCCPANLDDILESPHNEEECTTKCKFQNGMASVGNWVDDTCTCSLSAFAQCDPFGEVAQGYSTCQRYFNTFGDDNCNYNLKSHQLCANEDFDYDGNYIQIRDLCPDQCATVAFVQDSLDETVIFDMETGEAVKMSNDRRQLWRTDLIGKPYGAIFYEHKNGKGTAWRIKTRHCCFNWPWSSSCVGKCRSSGTRPLKKSNNKVSSISLAPKCSLRMYQHGTAWGHYHWGSKDDYENKKSKIDNFSLHGERDDYYSSFNLECDW